MMFLLVFDIMNDLFGGGLTDTKTGKPALPLKLIGQFKSLFDPSGGIGFNLIDKIRDG